MLAIFKRELRSYFTSPIGYIFVSVYLAVSGFAFSYYTIQTVLNDGETKIGSFFLVLIWILSITIPLLTMKSFSEERKMKTEQLIITSPVSIPAMVTAKFLSSYVIFLGTYLVSCLNYIVLYIYQPDAVVAANLTVSLTGSSIAILLIGAAFTAVGIFISSLTENQIVAVLGTITVLLISLLCSSLNSFIDSQVIRSVLTWISLYSRFSNFTAGVFDYSALLYYTSISFVFLFLTVRIYERRRWS